MSDNKSVVEIVVNPEKCMGCLMCALRCSLRYSGVFNPLKARIRIKGLNGNEIRFTEECNNCGLCADYCIYGALVVKEGG
ncbi:MAG: 4Fe-4S binding protein [Candidatus Jordarchaeum sp.]|uniref:4Fe-4S binding protein n=1 Tax=Candidatus Jordarchaeum sp. TaxID=2823881 RepID=UPI00404AC8EC